MEEISKKKSNKGLVALVVVLIILLLGSIGYICYDKGVFDGLLGKDKVVEEFDQKEAESLVEGYQFRLKDIVCKNKDYSCEKEQKVSYNGKNHNLKIKFFQELDSKNKAVNLNYALYIDNNLINTWNGFVLNQASYSFPNDKVQLLSDYDLNFDGYIYVFNEKYLGILYGYSDWGTKGYRLNLYNENGLLSNPLQTSQDSLNDSIIIDESGQQISSDKNSPLDGIDNINFDGNTLKYWFLPCDSFNSVNHLGLTFNGSQVTINVLETKDNVSSGGSAGCFNPETYKYGG